MTRTLKFRAWDGKKMWQYAVPLLSKAYNGGTINVSDNEDGSFNQFINGELMQFTGLYDKNGKEIYKSDICLIFNIPIEIKYHLCGFGYFYTEEFIPLSQHNIRIIDNKCQDVEIIGNIYQNHQLLEVQS